MIGTLILKYGVKAFHGLFLGPDGTIVNSDAQDHQILNYKIN
jgi:hypothetical protein